MGLSNVFSGWGYAFLAGILYKSSCILLRTSKQTHMMLLCLIIGSINLDHLGKFVMSGFFTVKILLFLLQLITIFG